MGQVYASALRQQYTDREGAKHEMTPENIRVVVPHNMQVNLLKQVLPKGRGSGPWTSSRGKKRTW